VFNAFCNSLFVFLYGNDRLEDIQEKRRGSGDRQLENPKSSSQNKRNILKYFLPSGF
jgi:hypothetical protein